MIQTYHDVENSFKEKFNPKTGFYIRSGILTNGKDTGVDPFMRNFPGLIDIGIMGSCTHSKYTTVANMVLTGYTVQDLHPNRYVLDTCSAKI